jgi:hypothetical protein
MNRVMVQLYRAAQRRKPVGGLRAGLKPLAPFAYSFAYSRPTQPGFAACAVQHNKQHNNSLPNTAEKPKLGQFEAL